MQEVAKLLFPIDNPLYGLMSEPFIAFSKQLHTLSSLCQPHWLLHPQRLLMAWCIVQTPSMLFHEAPFSYTLTRELS